jgi:nitrite reductase/ring-hydroxylating ferredoxin subunit/DMSO/TMAO reductase YedYZ heme-binding membrane subunit
MTVGYKAVGWNRQKKIYDAIILGGVLFYLGVFVAAGLLIRPHGTFETLLIRALGTAALLLLHIILSIGPLCRLNRKFLPLLYNRRHLGVTMFVLALLHGMLSVFQFHALGDTNPLLSLLSANTRFDSLSQFPFEILGVAALVILFLMAATSHDFWLVNLSAPVWKRLHMLVYLAYGLLVMHVALGVLQSETHPTLALLLGLGVTWILGLHLVAGLRERETDRELANPGENDLVDVCGVDEIEDPGSRIITLAGDRLAIFRYDGKISALSNACKHQNGPLGEGRIVNGCVVCPWHGYEYRLASGQSPPPFTEKVPTFRVQLREGRVLVDPEPLPPGTPVEPAEIGGPSGGAEPTGEDFYVGYRPTAPPRLARFVRRSVAYTLVIAGAVALLATAAQRPFAASHFEFGNPRSFTGAVTADPYPSLAVPRPGSTPSDGAVSRYLLVGSGKSGAESEIEGMEGHHADLSGTLIYRADQTMLEVTPGSVKPITDAGDHAASEESLGVQTLRGEIVDSKCYLGVMKPGDGKPHRGCAARCISGGVPPLLVVSDGSGRTAHFILVDENMGVVNRRILHLVAEPVEVTGEIIRRGNQLFLKSDPARYRRLSTEKS